MAKFMGGGFPLDYASRLSCWEVMRYEKHMSALSREISNNKRE